jgi:quercetin dioxygenase-like cupin family protein
MARYSAIPPSDAKGRVGVLSGRIGEPSGRLGVTNWFGPQISTRLLSTETEEIMRRLLIATCATAGLLVGTALAPASAVAQSETTQVLKTDLQGEEGREANIVRFEVGPDWETERHIHPGHVFVYILEGTIEIDVEGKDTQTFSTGEAFYEMPDVPMRARTAGTEEGATFIVFQVGPTGEPLMVAQPEE